MIYLGAQTTPLQEQLAPPDDCRNCLNQNVLAAVTNAHDNIMEARYECPQCGYKWKQPWRIEPIQE